MHRGCIQGSPSTCIGRSLLVLEPPNQRNHSEILRVGEPSSLPPQRKKWADNTCSLEEFTGTNGTFKTIIFNPSQGLTVARLGPGLGTCAFRVTIGIYLNLCLLYSDLTLGNCRGHTEGHSHLENWPVNMAAPLLSRLAQSSDQPEGKRLMPSSTLE